MPTQKRLTAHQLSPPLGHTDHNLVCLRLTYTPVVRKTPPTKKVIRLWFDDGSEALTDCFE